MCLFQKPVWIDLSCHMCPLGTLELTPLKMTSFSSPLKVCPSCKIFPSVTLPFPSLIPSLGLIVFLFETPPHCLCCSPVSALLSFASSWPTTTAILMIGSQKTGSGCSRYIWSHQQRCLERAYYIWPKIHFAESTLSPDTLKHAFYINHAVLRSCPEHCFSTWKCTVHPPNLQGKVQVLRSQRPSLPFYVWLQDLESSKLHKHSDILTWLSLKSHFSKVVPVLRMHIQGFLHLKILPCGSSFPSTIFPFSRQSCALIH